MTATNNPLPVIVLVDDDPNLLFGMKELIQQNNYTIHTAKSGNEALQRIITTRPDLVICDVHIPPPNGFEVQRALKNFPTTRNIPFIFLTASSSKSDVLKGLENGADDYITKPFDADILLLKIRTLIRRTRKQAEDSPAPATDNIFAALPAAVEQTQKQQAELSDNHNDSQYILRLTLIQILNTLSARAVELWWKSESGCEIEFFTGVLSHGLTASNDLDEEIETLQSSNQDALTKSTNQHYQIPIFEGTQIRGFLWILNHSQDDLDQQHTTVSSLVDYISIIMEKIDRPSQVNQLAGGMDENDLKVIQGLIFALDLRDQGTGDHSIRVTELTMSLAKRYGLHGKQLDNIRYGAMIHDIGKIGIPDQILSKPGPLTDEEWVIMRKHPLYSIKLLAHFPFLNQALDIPLYHHERWDGKGYPFSLSGNQIPIAAQLFSIVDAWDALTSKRAYHAARTSAEARQIISGEIGRAYNPLVVKTFLDLIDDLERTI